MPVFLLGCQKATPAPAVAKAAAAAEPAAPSWSDTIPQDRVVDDTARFLAGMPANSGSQFAALEQDKAWVEHRQLMDAAWARADEKLIKGLKEFQQRELSAEPFDRNLLFILSVARTPSRRRWFFRRVRPTISWRSNRRGRCRRWPSCRKRWAANISPGSETTVASELGKSFFVTREMDRQFRGQVTDGLLVPVLLLLVRTDHTVLGFKYVRLDEKGEVIDRPNNAHVDTKYPNKGFVVEFRTEGDKSVHRLVLFVAQSRQQPPQGQHRVRHVGEGDADSYDAAQGDRPT